MLVMGLASIPLRWLRTYDQTLTICDSRDIGCTCLLPHVNAGISCWSMQALLDMYTIQQEVGHVDSLKIGLVGDLANGRTVRSLAYLLSMYDNVKMYFVAPDVVRMKDDIKEFLTGRQVQAFVLSPHQQHTPVLIDTPMCSYRHRQVILAPCKVSRDECCCSC